jgi:hypothetical protein
LIAARMSMDPPSRLYLKAEVAHQKYCEGPVVPGRALHSNQGDCFGLGLADTPGCSLRVHHLIRRSRLLPWLHLALARGNRKESRISPLRRSSRRDAFHHQLAR